MLVYVLTTKTTTEEEPAMKRLSTRAVIPGLALALLALALTLAPPRQALAEPAAQVVYHADFADPRRFSAMLTSINNMMNFYENDLIEADVRIVFVAHGIRFLTDEGLDNTPFAADAELNERRENLKGRLLSLAEVRGVKLELCDITRAQIRLPEGKLYDTVTLVPSGVVRIAELQKQGFSYIKIE
jgi:intracellular sulfur oxidation DsrE/DsrF family protein